MTYLVENEDKVYPRLAELGAKTRHTMEAAFAQEGIYAPCTGHGNEVLSGSSLAFVHFPYKEEAKFDRPEDVFDPSLCDTTLSEKVLVLALLMENVHVIHGHGALCTAHTEADVEFLGEACRRVARRIKPYL
jgi:glutamate-1-semialdehyde aminotransferase